MQKNKNISTWIKRAAVSLVIIAGIGFVSGSVQTMADEEKTDAEIAALAQQVLTEIAESESFVERSVSDSGGTSPRKITIFLYYDNGKYYEEETIAGDEPILIESFFDGECGWRCEDGENWLESPYIVPEPNELWEMRSYADQFSQDACQYENYTYEDGVITCQTKREELDQQLEFQIEAYEMMLEDAPLLQKFALKTTVDRYKAMHYDQLTIKMVIDEETGRLKSYERVFTITETEGESTTTTDHISTIEILPEINAADKVNEIQAKIAD